MFRNLLERLFVERMDQNEEIFVRHMNDAPFRDILSGWMASEAYRRLRTDGSQADTHDGGKLITKTNSADRESFA